ncbi:MAG: Peptidase M23 [Microgenomates group bacterium GW2011_GWC1_37_8]|uniref:Peptidase M23 n=1 Tax=Candidatus Woesebacteria bacterium GW2011_GWB1_38_8 TaxID=1618570 RepID=A0A0G0LB75_9BACT|nr:MAG: Peptidase M23 [Microgenomates group bacterium GW2011_GWC1_37_8]KKQ85095.1 MAG: Peptidase M23 [Candidatus Woesebacteria bacterium GW2011_GWB1_38_8]
MFYRQYLKFLRRYVFPAGIALFLLITVYVIVEAQPNLKFPWDAPDKWYFTQGPHKWGSLAGSGIDFAPGPKSAVLSSSVGDVNFAGWTSWKCADGSSPANLNVRINHGSGWETWYLHLGSTSWGTPGTISPSISVGQGEYVGEAASTGCSTGKHIHLELVVNGNHENWDGKTAPVG